VILTTDHQLLTATMKIRLKNQKKNTTCLRFDVSSDTTEYRIEVANGSEALRAVAEERDRDLLWAEVKTVMLDAAQKQLPTQRNKHKNIWISEDTLELADKKRNCKLTGNKEGYAICIIEERGTKEYTKRQKQTYQHAF